MLLESQLRLLPPKVAVGAKIKFAFEEVKLQTEGPLFVKLPESMRNYQIAGAKRHQGVQQNLQNTSIFISNFTI